MYRQLGTLIFGTSLLLVGCGGGGGSSSSSTESLSYDGPTAAVVITSDNADSVAGKVVELESTSTALSTATNVISLSATTGTTSPFNLKSLNEIAKKYADMAIQADPASNALPARTTESQTQQCSGGGSITISATYSDPNTLSSGDSIAMTFSNCIESGSKTNGAITLSLTAVVFTGSTLDSFSAQYAFSNLKTTNTTSGDYAWLHGGFSASFSGDGYATPLESTLTGTSLIVEQLSGGVLEQAQLTNFSFVDTWDTSGNYTFDHDYTIASTDIGGSITVDTVTAFYLPSGNSYPTSGQVIIYGANDTKVRLTAQPDGTNVYIEYDIVSPHGSEDYEANATVTWLSLQP